MMFLVQVAERHGVGQQLIQVRDALLSCRSSESERALPLRARPSYAGAVTRLPVEAHSVITVLPPAGRACAGFGAASASSREMRVIGGARMRPSATACATRSKSSLDACKAKLMPVTPVLRRASSSAT